MNVIVRALTLVIVAFSFAANAVAQSAESRSAWRDPAKSYLDYKAQAFSSLAKTARLSETPMDVAKPYSVAKLPKATEWGTPRMALTRFRDLRDRRWLISPQQPGFLRRSSWMYPDDGCFARASLAVANSKAAGYPVPKKVFAFGNLKVQTANSSSGYVYWWYHVAPLVEVQGEKFVIDPALEPFGPISLKDWLARMSSDPGRLEVAVCGSGTYTPSDLCEKDTDGIEAVASNDQIYYLDAEWERLLDLGRMPDSELGENPPWAGH